MDSEHQKPARTESKTTYDWEKNPFEGYFHHNLVECVPVLVRLQSSKEHPEIDIESQVLRERRQVKSLELSKQIAMIVESPGLRSTINEG